MASKSKRRRKVLGASCILAALIIAGSSFAWFTSKDEVINRLSASSDYGVALAENFQPPENWIPGQEINKDVGAVNTGNVDAFVRTWMTGEMKVLNTTALLDGNSDVFGSFPANPKTSATTDENLKSLNLTGYKAVSNVNYYYKQLSDTQTTNPQTNGEQNQTDGYLYNGTRGTGTASTPNSSAYSEIQSIQAGGYLVSAPASAEYEYVTDQETELKVYIDSTNTAVTTTVPRGYLVKVLNATNIAGKSSGTIGADDSVTLATSNDTAIRGTTNVNTVYVLAQAAFKPVNVDTETFAPYTAGTYIFARNVDLNSSDTTVTTANLDDYEFAGYYFDAVEANGSKAGKGGYWALKNADANGTNRSDYTLPKKYAAKVTDAGAVAYKGEASGVTAANAVLTLVFDNSGELSTVTPTDKLEMYTAAYKEVENSSLTWVYDDTNMILSAIYQNGTDLNLTTDTTAALKDAKLRDDIVVDIKLANVVDDNTNENWKFVNKSTGDTVNYYAYSEIGTNGTYDTTVDPTGAIDANRLWTFYYTNDVEAGDSTAKLVDSVTLRSTTQKEAFIAFDFDLKINLESVQVTLGEDGNEKTTPVEAATGVWAGSDTAKTGSYATAQDITEIASIEWN